MKFRSPIEVALSQISSLDTSIRKLGAQALCALQPQQEATVVQEAFRLERHPGVAKWLALTLGKMGKNKGSIEVLEARLKVLPDSDLRDWILVSLNLINSYARNKKVTELLESSDPAVNKEGLILAWRNPRVQKSTIKTQRYLLESGDPSVRRWASLSLGSRKDFIVDEAVLEHLADPDYLALEWTEHAITGKVPEEALQTLETNLAHQEPRVREWAIKALASNGATGVYARLIKHYSSETDDFCRDAIIRSLAPVSAMPEVHDFLVRCAKTAISPVIILALIDVASTSATLRADVSFAAALVKTTSLANSVTLQSALERSFSAQLSPTDSKLLRRMDGSKDARQTWDFLSTLPWATANGEHKNLQTSVRNWNSRMTTNAGECDVVVLIAKKEEFRSFLPLLGEYEPDDDLKTGKSSYHSQVTGVDGQPIHLVALLVGGMGNERSVFWAQKLNEAMRPSILVNIGIAGGIHEDVRLGDVIVANQVENYLSDARAVPVKDGNGFVLDLAGDAFKTDASLVSIIQNFEFSHSGAFLAWRNECKRASQEIPSEKREMLIAKEFLRAEPRIEEGHVASGPIVGAAAAFVSWLKGKGDRSYLALEMESAGGGLAIHESATSTRHLVIRGISDFGDERKKELDSIGRGGVRNLAMQNATRLLITILQSVRMPIIRGLRI